MKKINDLFLSLLLCFCFVSCGNLFSGLESGENSIVFTLPSFNESSNYSRAAVTSENDYYLVKCVKKLSGATVFNQKCLPGSEVEIPNLTVGDYEINVKLYQNDIYSGYSNYFACTTEGATICSVEGKGVTQANIVLNAPTYLGLDNLMKVYYVKKGVKFSYSLMEDYFEIDFYNKNIESGDAELEFLGIDNTTVKVTVLDNPMTEISKSVQISSRCKDLYEDILISLNGKNEFTLRLIQGKNVFSIKIPKSYLEELSNYLPSEEDESDAYELFRYNLFACPVKLEQSEGDRGNETECEIISYISRAQPYVIGTMIQSESLINYTGFNINDKKTFKDELYSYDLNTGRKDESGNEKHRYIKCFGQVYNNYNDMLKDLNSVMTDTYKINIITDDYPEVNYNNKTDDPFMKSILSILKRWLNNKPFISVDISFEDMDQCYVKYACISDIQGALDMPDVKYLIDKTQSYTIEDLIEKGKFKIPEGFVLQNVVVNNTNDDPLVIDADSFYQSEDNRKIQVTNDTYIIFNFSKIINVTFKIDGIEKDDVIKTTFSNSSLIDITQNSEFVTDILGSYVDDYGIVEFVSENGIVLTWESICNNNYQNYEIKDFIQKKDSTIKVKVRNYNEWAKVIFKFEGSLEGTEPIQKMISKDDCNYYNIKDYLSSVINEELDNPFEYNHIDKVYLSNDETYSYDELEMLKFVDGLEVTVVTSNE